MPLWYTSIAHLSLKWITRLSPNLALNSWQSAIMLIYRSKSLIFVHIVLWMLVLIRVSWFTSELSALIYNFNNSSNSNHNNLVNKLVHHSARQRFNTKMRTPFSKEIITPKAEKIFLGWYTELGHELMAERLDTSEIIVGEAAHGFSHSLRAHGG